MGNFDLFIPLLLRGTGNGDCGCNAFVGMGPDVIPAPGPVPTSNTMADLRVYIQFISTLQYHRLRPRALCFLGFSTVSKNPPSSSAFLAAWFMCLKRSGPR